MRRARRACVLAVLAGLVPAAQAAETQPPAKKPTVSGTTPTKPPPAKPAAPVPEADDELLEFLGSLDAESDDEEWLDYLAQTDVAKVAKDKKK